MSPAGGQVKFQNPLSADDEDSGANSPLSEQPREGAIYPNPQAAAEHKNNSVGWLRRREGLQDAKIEEEKLHWWYEADTRERKSLGEVKNSCARCASALRMPIVYRATNLTGRCTRLMHRVVCISYGKGG